MVYFLYLPDIFNVVFDWAMEWSWSKGLFYLKKWDSYTAVLVRNLKRVFW